MKSLLWAGAALFTLVIAVGAQAQLDMTRILFGTQSEHHFGPVKRGATLSHNFRMHNTFQIPLTIVDIRNSCGCSTANPAKNQLRPGEAINLEVRVDTRRFMGPKTVVTYVRVKGPGLPEDEAKLVVTANSQ